MRLMILFLAVAFVGTLLGCSKEEAAVQQTTPPPTPEQLGTGQQFGYPAQAKK